MYWLLLPPSANAGRTLSDLTVPLGGFWSTFFHAGWAHCSHIFAFGRR
jgi:hypothetical protein